MNVDYWHYKDGDTQEDLDDHPAALIIIHGKLSPCISYLLESLVMVMSSEELFYVNGGEAH